MFRKRPELSPEDQRIQDAFVATSQDFADPIEQAQARERLSHNPAAEILPCMGGGVPPVEGFDIKRFQKSFRTIFQKANSSTDS